MTQRERIIDYMVKFQTITPMEAFADLGITKLSTRVSEMRADGIVIIGERVSSKNRFGEKVSFMRYRLPDESEVV